MRFGIGRRDITPPLYTHMHGYAARRDTNDGVNDPLTFTAIVMEELEDLFASAVVLPAES